RIRGRTRLVRGRHRLPGVVDGPGDAARAVRRGTLTHLMKGSVGCAFRLQTRIQPRGPGCPCWPQAPEIPGESGSARNSDEIRKRRKAQEMRVPDPMAHDFGLGSDFSEASTPRGRAVRRPEEPSDTFGLPGNWTAERCFLRRCYRNPQFARDPDGRVAPPVELVDSLESDDS